MRTYNDDDEVFDEHGVLKPGKSIRVRMTAMDSLSRSVAGISDAQAIADERESVYQDYKRRVGDWHGRAAASDKLVTFANSSAGENLRINPDDVSRVEARPDGPGVVVRFKGQNDFVYINGMTVEQVARALGDGRDRQQSDQDTEDACERAKREVFGTNVGADRYAAYDEYVKRLEGAWR